MKIQYTERAASDIKIAFDWYEQQKIDLGIIFLNSIEDSLHKIQDYPEVYPKPHKNFHRCILSRFPFSSIEDNLIIIHSIFNNRQNPENKP
ncbi:MAG: type II toxin-antitoxin system RelE/ParE family toxin [Calditrichaeota bacterium]|nr:MAG: type II toxin-antitoxin system RelE/ParE family toxin [Calditrichota bacterium]MBL1204496.1 type II toxin-antitoxin system RelE/ParE family toxin [Calditrichota bacterium]NOG44325.1 type II toxin-antitoxin system RelE/ParE family toxin [Calditrichota bacterium]